MRHIDPAQTARIEMAAKRFKKFIIAGKIVFLLGFFIGLFGVFNLLKGGGGGFLWLSAGLMGTGASLSQYGVWKAWWHHA